LVGRDAGVHQLHLAGEFGLQRGEGAVGVGAQPHQAVVGAHRPEQGDGGGDPESERAVHGKQKSATARLGSGACSVGETGSYSEAAWPSLASAAAAASPMLASSAASVSAIARRSASSIWSFALRAMWYAMPVPAGIRR